MTHEEGVLCQSALNSGHHKVFNQSIFPIIMKIKEVLSLSMMTKYQGKLY